MTSVLKSVSLPLSLVLSALIFKTGGGGWGFHLNKRASASLVGDSLTQRAEKKKRERENEGKRTWEVSSMRQTTQSSAGTGRALHQWRLTQEPTHGGFPRLPPTFLTISPSHLPPSLSSLPSTSPLLWNKCQMANKHSSACGCSEWPP